MTKIAFILDSFERSTALGRVILSFACELQASHQIETVILAAYASPESTSNLPQGVTVQALSVTDSISIGRLAYQDYLFDTIGKKLTHLVENFPADFYIHTSSDGYSISSARRTGSLGYFSHGEIYGCFFSEPWFQRLDTAAPVKWLMRLAAPVILSKVSRQLQTYDFFLANSNFSKEQLFLLTGIHSRRVYLPVDVDVFRPDGAENRENYLLAVGSPREIEVDTIAQLAQKTRVVRVGKYPIIHCENRGFVNEQELVALYRGATATLFPHHHEEFGLIPVESMACGTPVLTYSEQGPGETVVNDWTGWTVDTTAQFIAKGLEIFNLGVSSEMRGKCRSHVLKNFSPGACTIQLLACIGLLPS